VRISTFLVHCKFLIAMVKGSPRFVADARIESSSRTLPISEKMAVGKVVVPVAEINNRFESQFNGERMIHGKIREFTLRSAAHWSEVNGVVSPFAARSTGTHVPVNSEKEQAFDLALINYVHNLPSHVLKTFGVDGIQKGLREFVVVHMIRDEMKQEIKHVLAYGENSSKILKSSSGAVSVSRSRDGGFAHVQDSSVLNMHVFDVQLGTCFKRDLGGHSNWFSTWGNRISDNFYSSPLHKPVEKLPYVSKICSSFERDGSLGTLSCSIFLNDRSGFGTAPIWYQQSMATGPPIHDIAGLERKIQLSW
jgi:hypothetical protein